MENKQIINNIGFNLEKEIAEQSDKDWIFGSGEPTTGLGDEIGSFVGAIYAYPDPINGVYPRTLKQLNHAVDFLKENAKEYVPVGQVQRGRADWMNCASNAPVNEYEKEFNFGIDVKKISEDGIAWLKEKGYLNQEGGFEASNAFVSIGSGTTPQGNSLKAPFEFIRLNGLIPLSILPDDKSMNWNEYHNPKRITQAMWDLGKEFKERFPMNYEKVLYADFGKFTDNLKWEIFDSYVDPVDGDFIKRLASNYNMLDYSYRAIFNEIIKKKEGETMKLEIEVIKQKDSPDFLFKGKKSGNYHRFGDVETFNEVVGDFPSPPEEKEIAQEMIASPLYLTSSLMAIILNIFNKLKGK